MNFQPGLPQGIERLEPRAPATGPFARPAFLAAVTELTGEAVATVSDDATALVVVSAGGEVRLAGDSDLTDYHCPLGSEVKSAVACLVDTASPGTRFRFDSLPGEAADEIVDAFAATGLRATSVRHAVTAVVDISAGYDAYLDAIGKKQRHEVRRKRRRYEDEVGDLIHEVHHAHDWALEEFFRLHRLSAGDKGEFMTAEHERFFRTLAAQEGWRIDVLRMPGEDRATATLFSYVDDEGVYLYNSAYDPALRDASPGVAIVGSMIEQACHEGVPRFDFLKGDEVYKFRLGAHERPLYEVVARK
ncbi:MAG TPA: GNAT family N-acetyltransferase [Acidimicrobiia bacterium]|nr:GNAT family N-acetyltransferase [Acidimicrobiia bacterium]